jgi:DNA-binding beta-propeller fold protein YncE
MRRIALATLTLSAIVLAACASGPRTREPNDIRVVFPSAPAEPVIEWVTSYATLSDVGAGGSSFRRALTGESDAEPGLVAPTAVAIAPDSTLYVVDQELDGLVVINEAQERFDLFRGDGRASLTRPTGVAVDGAGRVFVTDAAGRVVHVFGSDLRYLRSLGGPDLFVRPTGLALTDDGTRLAVCDTGGHAVHVIDPEDGQLLFSLGGVPRSSAEGEFHTPYTVAFDQEGYLYVSDYLNFRIQVFAPDGTFEMAFGQAGDRPGDLNRPRGLAADSDAGVVYVVDGAFQVVQMFNLDGEVLMWFGAPGEGRGGFELPSGIARRGDILAVADTLNSRVQLFRFLGSPETSSLTGE